MAIPALRALHGHPAVALQGAVAQPDRPFGRRREPRPCPVKAEAAVLGLPVATPDRIGSPEAMAQLRDWGVQLAVVCAYGQIFPQALLELPALGCFNLHFSLLPRWRGASPVQAAILAGDAETGVTLQKMVRELDAGDVVAATAPLSIGPRETSAGLGGRLADAAAELLRGALPALAGGDPPLTPQDEAGVTLCRLVKKEDGAVDFSAESAGEIDRKCRAYTPWPGCFAFLADKRLGLARVAPAEAPADAEGAGPGVLHRDGRVAAREGWLLLERVKPEGKGEMDWRAFFNGNPGAAGCMLTPHPA